MRMRMRKCCRGKIGKTWEQIATCFNNCNVLLYFLIGHAAQSALLARPDGKRLEMRSRLGIERILN